MRKLLTIGAVLVMMGVATAAFAQYENCLFFSEYVEGSSYNKAVEIYNATETDIDLGTVAINTYFNGNPVASGTMTLAAVVLPSGGTYVIAHPSADPAILAVADETNGSAINFNGDDAVELVLGGVTVDVIGQIGFDPGTAWGTAPTTTVNATLRRLPSVCCGDPDGFDAFDPALQWEGYPQDTFDGLGQHVADCQAVPADQATFGVIKALYR
jgi:predicted extracellular nuclease